MARKGGRKRARFTDDSGTLISPAQYRELHGEPRVKRRALSSQPVDPEPPNIFAKILQAAGETERKIKVLECEYCHSIVPWNRIGSHTKTQHHTRVLQFRPAGERVIARHGHSKSVPSSQSNSIPDQMERSDGMAHFRRESNGQFGSYPLHDDYSDEADAE
jgi:hypothetical protein